MPYTTSSDEVMNKNTEGFDIWFMSVNSNISDVPVFCPKILKHMASTAQQNKINSSFPFWKLTFKKSEEICLVTQPVQ
jgi:hypothetical protein